MTNNGLIVLCAILVGGLVFAFTSSQSLADFSEEIETEVVGNTDDTVKTFDSWHFLRCVHSDHECEHEAHSHGYHHYKVRHHDWRCAWSDTDLDDADALQDEDGCYGK